jgi:predicted ATPase/signal transduction histidine kinase/CheY-like chemotaxis protein
MLPVPNRTAAADAPLRPVAADPHGAWTIQRGRWRGGTDDVLVVVAREPEGGGRPIRDALRRIDHPNVGRVLAEDWLPGGFVLLLEDPGGPSLTTLRGVPQGPATFLALAEGMAAGLAAIHAAGKVHGRLEMESYVLDASGSRAVLADLAAVAQAPVTLDRWVPRAPEQADGPLDARSDLYLLGGVLYALLTGRPAIEATDPLERRLLALAGRPSPPHVVIPLVPEPLSHLVLRLLARDPAERYPSARALQTDLEHARVLLAERGTIPPLPSLLRAGGPALRMPAGLAGRDGDRGVLLDALARAAAGACLRVELVGPPGVGKTSLLESLRGPTLGRGGCFGLGRVDPLRAPRPLGALAGALDEIAAQILSGDAARLERVRRSVARELGANGALVAALGRRLRWLVPEPGPQPKDEGVAAAAARLGDALERFVIAIADASPPLVLALDDLHRADTETLALVRALQRSPDAGHVLVLGAWRGDEAPDDLLGTASAPDAGTVRLELGGLALPALGDLLRAALGDLGDAAAPLTQLVYQRTNGNPLFVRAYLQHLAAAGAIHPAGPRAYAVDLGRAAAIDVGTGVATMLVEHLDRLPAAVREVLAVGARIGDTFTEDLVARVLDEPVDEVAARLAAAAEAGFVAPLPDPTDTTDGTDPTLAPSPATWRFLHDRLQQAALDLLDDGAGPARHARIGALLYAGLPPEPEAEALLRAVHQRNLGTLGLDPAAREDLAHANVRAARYARATGAFGAALGFADKALALLGDDPWQRAEDAMAVHFEGARAAIVAAPDRVDGFLEPIVCHAADPIVAAEAFELRADHHLNRSDPVAALDAMRAALARLGYRLPERIGKVHVGVALLRAQLALYGRSPEALLALPPVTDARLSSVLRVMLRGSTAAYLHDPDLFAYICCESLRCGLAAGACPGTAWGLLVFAIIRSAGLGDLAGGYQLGEVAGRMLADFRPHGLAAKFGSVWFVTQHHTHHPLRASLQPLKDMFRQGLAEGDPLHASINAAFYLNHLLFSGEPLEHVAEEMRRFADEMHLRRLDLSLQTSAPFRELARCLRGEVPVDALLDRGSPPPVATDKPFDLFSLALCRCVLATFLGRDAEALVHARGADAVRAAVAGTINDPLFLFHAAVAAGRRLATGEARDRTTRRRLRVGLDAMRRHARFNPVDYAGRVAHLEGLDAYRAGRPGDAFAPLDASVEAARAQGALQEAALALDTAARLHEHLGARETARLLRVAALDAWRTWGAVPLVEAATRRLGAEAPVAPPRPPVDPGIEVILRATEALAGDVARDALLGSLVRLAAMLAGAERVVLLGAGGDDLRVRAVLEDGAVALAAGVPLAQYGRACAAAARLAARTGEVVLEPEADRPDTFGLDPWARAAGVRSVLAIPVFLRGVLQSVLLLEHTHRTAAFAAADVTPLRVLASVAAALLENAELLATLAERATELHGANAALQGQRQLLEEAVRARTAELDVLTRLQASILDALSEGVFGLDAAGCITFANPAAARLLGVPIPSLVGLPFHDTFHVAPAGGPTKAERCSLCAAQLPRHEVAAQLRGAEARLLWVECSVQPLQDGARPGVRVFSVRDVGRRRDLEAQVRHSQKMEAIGLFVGGVAHEFNNLLTPILGRVEIAQEMFEPDHPIQDSLASVGRASRRAADLVRQLLALGRRTEVVRRPTDVSATVQEALRFLRPSLDRRITMVFEPAAASSWALADSGQVHQILLNLCLNARDAILGALRPGQPATISIVVRRLDLDDATAALSPPARPGVWIELEVTDTGPGMPPEVMSRIFEPFFTTKLVGEGSGLGLAVLHGIVQQHGGWVSVRTGPGEGTSFRCTFPALDGLEQEFEKEVVPAPTPQGGGRVLLVDDEAMVREITRTMLEQQGYSVVEAEGGRAALEALRNGPRPDIVVLDLIMPGMDGWETLARLRELDATIPVVLLSGFDSGSVPDGRPVVPDARLTKPFQMRELLAAVSQALVGRA